MPSFYFIFSLSLILQLPPTCTGFLEDRSLTQKEPIIFTQSKKRAVLNLILFTAITARTVALAHGVKPDGLYRGRTMLM